MIAGKILNPLYTFGDYQIYQFKSVYISDKNIISNKSYNIK